MSAGIIISFTVAVTSRNADIDHLQKSQEAMTQEITQIKSNRQKDHVELIRQGVILEDLRDETKEVSRDVKTLLRQTQH